MKKDNPEISAFFIRVEGRVQGVGFRYSCMMEGQRLGLKGWVKNTPNGDVEVWAEGTMEKLETLIQWLRRGPPGARVDTMDYNPHPPTGKYRDFNVGY